MPCPKTAATYPTKVVQSKGWLSDWQMEDLQQVLFLYIKNPRPLSDSPYCFGPRNSAHSMSMFGV